MNPCHPDARVLEAFDTTHYEPVDRIEDGITLTTGENVEETSSDSRDEYKCEECHGDLYFVDGAFTTEEPKEEEA